MEGVAQEVHHSRHVDFRHRIRTTAFQGLFRAERASASLCPCYHNGPYGRRLRHHICQSQSWILVGRSTALHHQYSWCFDDCLVYNITGD